MANAKIQRELSFSKSFEDFFSPTIFFVMIISMIITAGIIISLVYLGLDYAGSLTELLPHAFQEFEAYFNNAIESNSVLGFLIEHKLVMGAIHLLAYFGFAVVFYLIFLIIYGFVVGLFTGVIINYVHKKHYPNVQLKGMGFMSAIFFYIKTIIITILVLIVVSPTFFIPVLNFLIFLPIYYFFHKTIVFDVASVINDGTEYRNIRRNKWGPLKLQTMYCYLITIFLPIIGVLIYPYYIIHVGHYMFHETSKHRQFPDGNRRKRKN